MVNYILGQSHSGTTAAGVDDKIFGAYMQQDSKFAQAGANEFDGAIAKAYTAQFKGYAMGLNVAYKPGDNMDEIAANLEKGQATKMTAEAETVANVAAIYRGDLSGGGAYDNPALKKLVASWGRQDIANQPGMGDGDIQSVGGTVKALNEEPDPAKRQAWLQQIFDFQNNSPNSPSGAVPQSGLVNYQKAISLYRNGTVDQLANNYSQGIKTNGPVQVPNVPGGAGNGTGGVTGGTQDAGNVPGGAGNGTGNVPGATTTDANGNPAATPDVNRNTNFHATPIDQRSQLGLNDRDRAIDHLWGRQVISKGFQDGSVYKNVLDDMAKPADQRQYKAEEHKLVQQLVAKEAGLQDPNAVNSQVLDQNKARINGKALDQELFGLMQRVNPGQNIDTSRWMNAPAHAWDGNPINQIDDINLLQQQTGLNKFDQGVLRLWGHEPLLNGGKIDGSVLAYTIGNANALDNQGLSFGRVGGNPTSVDDVASGLLKADLASDGVRNGDSLRSSFGQVLDKVYLGAQGPTLEGVQQLAEQKGAANGRSVQQMQQDSEQGMVQALADSAKFVKDHPIISTMAVGGIAAATAVCPFLGAMGAGAAGIMAGQQMMNKGQGA
ncbi:MAG TPA: hypothetical protein V6C52_08890 [Coleofasciculaceae cyanobacterium]|jgi:hypothetical protein